MRECASVVLLDLSWCCLVLASLLLPSCSASDRPSRDTSLDAVREDTTAHHAVRADTTTAPAGLVVDGSPQEPLRSGPAPSLTTGALTSAETPSLTTGTLTTPEAPRFTIETLPIPGQRAALVVVPPRGKTPRPVLVAAHGAWDRPDWYCAWWGEFVGDRAFVLCPRGQPIGGKYAPPDQPYFYPDHHALEREVLAGLSALQQRYPDEVDTGAAVYVGFSQGATMGALVVGLHPGVFPRAIFIEGGQHEWPLYSARLFARGGGQRVLFACGTGWCEAPAREQVHHLERAGVGATIVIAKQAGHTPGGPVGEQVRAAFRWVVEGDARWAVEP